MTGNRFLIVIKGRADWEKAMNNHHLILGTLTDTITGRRMDDTHDERYRQKIARLLVDEKGYAKSDITPQFPLVVSADKKCARVPVTFVVAIDGQPAMIIHYGPGSLVTRHRPALAMARLASSHQIPFAVVTNGEDADILDGETGKVAAKGLAAIPDRVTLAAALARHGPKTVTKQQAQREARIVFAYEVDDRCPCDDAVCRLKGV
jgi:hypothetical protein